MWHLSKVEDTELYYKKNVKINQAGWRKLHYAMLILHAKYKKIGFYIRIFWVIKQDWVLLFVTGRGHCEFAAQNCHLRSREWRLSLQSRQRHCGAVVTGRQFWCQNRSFRTLLILTYMLFEIASESSLYLPTIPYPWCNNATCDDRRFSKWYHVINSIIKVLPHKSWK